MVRILVSLQPAELACLRVFEMTSDNVILPISSFIVENWFNGTHPSIAQRASDHSAPIVRTIHRYSTGDPLGNP